jgi:hypothetical protein
MKYKLLVIIVISFLGISGCGGATQREASPEFVSFEVEPSAVCMDTGIPIARVSFEITPGDWSPSQSGNLCVQIKAQGELVHPPACALIYGGTEDETSGEFTFNLTAVVGTNLNSVVDITGELIRDACIGCDADDTAYDTIQTLICGSPTPIP